jgi:hypothetical protein
MNDAPEFQHTAQQPDNDTSNPAGDTISKALASLHPKRKGLPEHLKKHCWPKGTSGCPTGKRKGTPSIKAALKRKLTRQIADEIADRLLTLARRGENFRAGLSLTQLLEPEEKGLGVPSVFSTANVTINLPGTNAREKPAVIESPPAPLPPPALPESAKPAGETADRKPEA